MTSAALTYQTMPMDSYAPSSSFTREAPSMSNLSDEILLKIFSYLSIKDLGAASSVSHRFHSITRDESLWDHRVKKIRSLWQAKIETPPYAPPKKGTSYYDVAKVATQNGWLLDVEHYVKVDNNTKTIIIPRDYPEDVRWKMILSAFHDTEVIKERSFALLRYHLEDNMADDAHCVLFFSPSKKSTLYYDVNVCELSTFHPVDSQRVLSLTFSLMFPKNTDTIEGFVEYKFVCEDKTAFVLGSNSCNDS